MRIDVRIEMRIGVKIGVRIAGVAGTFEFAASGPGSIAD